MAAPTLVASYNTINATGTSRNVTGVDWQTGDLILVKGNTENNPVTLTNPPTNASLTFTAVAGFPSNTTSQSKEYAWSAVAGSSQTAQTIAGSISVSANAGGYVVEVWRDHDGLGAITAPVAVASGTTVSTTIATTQENSALSCGMGDWSAAAVGATPYGTDPGAATNEFKQQFAAKYSAYHWYHADAGAVGTKTIAVTSAASMDPMIWAIEVLGIPDPATGAGQYGWGTYGAGDYGPNFGGVAATPQVGSDSFSLSESAPSITGDVQAAETHTQSEASAIAATLAASDSGTLSESPGSLSQQIAVTANETHTQTEDPSSVLTIDVKTANDAGSLGEASSVAATLAASESHAQTEGTTAISASLDASDALVFTDAPGSVLSFEPRAASDSSALTEAASTSASLGRSDSFGFTDLVSLLTADLSRADSGTFTDTMTSLQDVTLKSASDSLTVNDVVNTLTTTDFKAASDDHFVTDVVAGISAQLTASDLTALLEASAINASMLRSDAFSATELAAASQQVDKAANEAFSMNEAVALSAAIAASDSLSLTDSVLSLAQTAQIIASDSFGLNEQSNLAAIVAITRTDEFSLVTEVAGVVVVTESPYIHHEVPLDGIVQSLELGGTVLVLVSHGQIIDAVTSGATDEGVASGTPVANAADGIVFDSLDSGDDVDYIATV